MWAKLRAGIKDNHYGPILRVSTLRERNSQEKRIHENSKVFLGNLPTKFEKGSFDHLH